MENCLERGKSPYISAKVKTDQKKKKVMSKKISIS
jgi:hypothetical protein